MIEIDFQLRGARFMAERIYIQLLGFAPIINIFHDGIKIIGGINAISLSARFFAARTPYGSL